MKIASLIGVILLCLTIGCGGQNQVGLESNNQAPPITDVTQVCQLAQQALGNTHSLTDCQTLYGSPVNPNQVQPMSK